MTSYHHHGLGFTTLTGTVLHRGPLEVTGGGVLPSPSSQEELSPQQYATPSTVTPHTWSLPALMREKW